MKTIYLSFISLWVVACSFPGLSVAPSVPGTGTPDQTHAIQVGATAEIPRPTPTAPALGTVENPMILALAPASTVDGRRVAAGKAFADLLTEETGFTFVVVVPESYAKLVEALGQGNAHIAPLSPYAYAYAYDLGYATAAFASLKSGEKLYGAQFIARTDAGFEFYFDAATGENTAEAASALIQFNEKKPCWADKISPSGYIIPAGVLASSGVVTRPAAFLQGQPAVVRAVYAGGICDFGATYVDARSFPTVRESYPDALEKVGIVWQIPPVIPYSIMALATGLPAETSLGLQEAIFRISGRQAGREILAAAYGVGDWEPVSDPFYEPFRVYLKAAGQEWIEILDYEPIN